ncbi:hypothetical protein GCM10009641_66530 [Mycobacterium cookii]|uniref:DUF4439 domain-containing protein n=1 Tax=Nocardioides furvisabuli TaxID=375542 RepID=A0ABN2WMI0_9ACTN|nr:hypothetical protein [Nocardioides furvisabuli]
MPGRPLSRRTAVGSALATPLVLAACDIDPPPRDDASAASPPPPEDAELVATVVAALVRAEGVLAATAAAPGLAARLEPLVAAHAAHRELLAGAVADTELPGASPARVPDAPDRALAAVRRSEQRLLRQLREACVAAASGDLARVLASVAASTAQHSAALGSGTAA